MRSQLGKEVRKLFARGLNERVPVFKKIPAKLSHATVFAHSLAPDLNLYLVLQMHHMYDMFDVSMAWRSDDKVPDTGGLMPPPEAPDSPLFYIRELWGGRKADFWWQLAPPPSFDRPESFFQDVPLEQCLPKVQPAVEEALQKIDTYALPYFARVAAARGLRLPGTQP